MKRWIPKIFILLIISILYALPVAFGEKGEQMYSKPKLPKERECEITIQVEGQNERIPLETYVMGVIAGEMPITFHEEALKAQAIAARTYVLKTTNNGEKTIAPTVANQVFVDKEQREKRWGSNFLGNEKKLVEAVNGTKGQVITYENELITAMFHSTSNGQTESAYGYSGNELPYLQSVASTSDKDSPKFSSIQEWSLANWNAMWSVKWRATDFNQLKINRNESGRVERVTLGNNSWTGREVRTLLNLASTDFTISYNPTKQIVSVVTKGYGHGVGMSQYGADAMAKEGKTSIEIIKHYYQNVEIKKIDACLK